MPPEGFAPLSDSELDILLQWLHEGAAEGDAGATPANTAYTYYGHTKEIVDRKCAICHAPGELAPFSLTDYDSVFALRSAISQQVESGAMPPWPPTPHYVRLDGDRSLTGAEKATLKSWLDGGAPAGDPAAFVPADAAAPDTEFDLTLSTNEAFTPTRRPDQYRCLMVDWPLAEPTYITAVDLVPDVKEQVHHAFAVVVNPEDVPAFDAADGADGQPGFDCLGGVSPPNASVRPRLITVWAPGNLPTVFPSGTGVRVTPGSKLAIQLHYNTINTEPMPDQSSLRLKLADSVEREAITVFFQDLGWLAPGGMPIPAGDPAVTFEYTADLRLPLLASGGLELGLLGQTPVSIHTAFLHQHQLGASTSIELIREDGTEIMLVDIRDWDFDWQEDYAFSEEVIVHPNDKLRLTCTFDNSAENQQIIDGVQIEPRYVEFAEGTLDEMCVNYFFLTRAPDVIDTSVEPFPPTVAFHQPQYMATYQPGDYVPIELIVNAFRLQEPGTDHAGHGHMDTVDAPHNHRSGHYHIYLNSEEDSAEHLTNWETATFYRLPDDIPEGQHSFRVSLRNDQHNAIGVETRTTIQVAAPSDTAEAETLIAASAWQPMALGSDSWIDHQPEEVHCPDNAWYVEDGALEVETGFCNYLALTQPSLAPIRSGDTLSFTLWHGPLRFDEPAESHVAISVAGNVVWEDYIEIPNKGGIYDLSVPASFSAQAGAPVEYHLHNHGYNTWTLLALKVER